MRDTDRPARRKFNYNKLQAVLCIVASAFASIALIIWGISSLG